MSKTRCASAVLVALLATVPAGAAERDVLAGKFTFNWHVAPAGQRCAVVSGKLLAEFKSARYRCDLKPKTNTSAGSRVRTCTQVGGRKEYLIFDTLRACEEERKTQASHE